MSEPRTFRAGPVRFRVSTATPPKERLTTDRVVDAALDLMARQGYDAVSMRAVARELDTGPASLYAHVANREELDQLVVDRIAAEISVPEPDPERWAEQVKEMMRDTLRLYRAHPGAARATLGMIPTSPGSLRLFDGLMAVCLAGGVPPRAAAWFCDVVALYVGSTAVEEAIWDQRSRALGGTAADVPPQVAAFMAALSSADYPALSAHADVLSGGGQDARFEFGLDLLVSGLTALAGVR